MFLRIILISYEQVTMRQNVALLHRNFNHLYHIWFIAYSFSLNFWAYDAVFFFQVVQGNDSMVKRGITTNISVRHQCITVMSNYDKKSIEVGFINNQTFHLRLAGLSISFSSISSFTSIYACLEAYLGILYLTACSLCTGIVFIMILLFF